MMAHGIFASTLLVGLMGSIAGACSIGTPSANCVQAEVSFSVSYDVPFVTSPNGDYATYCQPDGNFVLYQILKDGSKQATWSSSTSGQFNMGSCTLHSDGNFALLDTDGNIRWTSVGNAHGKGPDYNYPSCACMQDDANFVIYNGIGLALWSQWWPKSTLNTTGIETILPIQV